MGKKILLGNEAIAHGILAAGANVVASYPGTPASEVCEVAMDLVRKHNIPCHVEWSINEKTAAEVAFANSISSLRSAAIMKQVGLNVASDPVISAAYMGTIGGFLIVVADDPGPHSSQTEQDTRFFAMHAKLPVLDPSSPEEAMKMTLAAFEFSEQYKTPVLLRPTTRVCHARQLVEVPEIRPLDRKPYFEKDPYRWAATPGPRLKLHKELNAKLAQISKHEWARPKMVYGESSARMAIVSSGVAYAYIMDLLRAFDKWKDVCVYKVDMPYPMDQTSLHEISKKHKKVLVVEETEPVIEMQFPNRENVSGRIDSVVPNAGELTPEIVIKVLDDATGTRGEEKEEAAKQPRRPALCAGCGHRSAFYAIKRALPKGIYTSDIGCYTLGLNLGGVDTCLCMGAAVSQAAGFHHAFKDSPKPPPIAAVIGDSTYFHAGIPPTINALITGARFVLVILDNATTAMTGHQPTPATGHVTSDYTGRTLQLEQILKGCGIETVFIQDPYDVNALIETTKEAYRLSEDQGVVAIIARHPCIRDKNAMKAQPAYTIHITQECNACGYCVMEFECPAIEVVENSARIDSTLCIGCGVCVDICPRKAIVAEEIK